MSDAKKRGHVGSSDAAPGTTIGGNADHAWGDGPPDDIPTDEAGDHPSAASAPLPDEAYPVGPFAKFAPLPIWVAWEKKVTEGKTEKPLYGPNGRYADHGDPKTWGTLDQAKAVAAKLRKLLGLGGIGILLTRLNEKYRFGGVDLDTCRNPETGVIEPWARSIIDRYASYTEISPSGTGVKIFFLMDETPWPEDLATTGVFKRGGGGEGDYSDHSPGIEFYTTKRYFTVTGQQYGEVSELRVVPVHIHKYLLEDIGPLFKGQADAPPDETKIADKIAAKDKADAVAVADALTHLSADEYSIWINYGLAIKERFGDAGFPIWDAWSKTSPKYSEAEIINKWRDDITPRSDNPVRVGTIFDAAEATGEWVPPWKRNNKQGQGQEHAHEVDEEPLPPPAEFPAPMAKEAFHGVLGEIVEILLPHTHVSRENLLIHLLVGLGNMVDHAPYFQIGGDRHYTNLFALVIGESGIGKGSGWSLIECVLGDIDRNWANSRVASGLESAEGLIEQVRDPLHKEDGTLVDPGVDDKRFLAIEEDFVRGPVQSMRRAGNKLNDTLRKAHGGKILESLTRRRARDSQVTLKATDAHISIIGHAVRAEVLQFIDPIETENGFLNRFLITAVGMGADVVFPTPYDELRPKLKRLTSTLSPLMDKWAGNEDTGKHAPTLIPWNDDAMKRYEEIYREYQVKRKGMTARSLPHIIRLALLYAVLDGSDRIRRHHLDAGLAVMRHSEASLFYLFGAAPGNKYARSVLSELRHAGSTGCPRRSLLRTLRCSADELDIAIDALHSAGSIKYKKVRPTKTSNRTGGRASTVWFIAEKAPKGAE